jgi:hypothetical protein
LFGEGLEVGKEDLKPLADRAGRPAPASSVSPSSKKGFSKERVEAVLKSGGKLSRAELLRCRVRWFSDGVAIGSKGFVEGVFQGCRSFFGVKRKDGARRVKQDASGTLHALRELRVEAVS